jgi:hypothetical protein
MIVAMIAVALLAVTGRPLFHPAIGPLLLATPTRERRDVRAHG